MEPKRISRKPRSVTSKPLRRWSFAVLLALFLLLVAACGSDSDDSAEEAGTDAANESADFAGDEEMEMEIGDSSEAEVGVEAAGDADAPDVAQATTVPPAEPSTGAVDQAQGGDESEGDVDTATDETAAEGEAADDTEGALGAGGTRVTPTAADLGRKLVFTANVNVEVVDVAAASAEATTIIEDMGGFLFGQNTAGGAEASSELVFKVLPDDFNRALEALGTVGELRNQTVTTDDVTERIVDLDSRIRVADLGVARLRAALEGAATLEDFAEIERLLLDRESTLEVMRGQLRTLQDRVDLATITLLLTQDRVENVITLDVSSYEEHDGGASCPGQEGFDSEAGAAVTVCFDIINQGDQTLTDIVLTDTVLDIDGDTELIAVFGALDELAPGQSALVAYEFNPERSLRLRTRVVAIPTDGVSSEQTGPSVSTQINFNIRTFEPETDPGFGDGFSAGVGILKALWRAFVLAFSFLLPLLVVLIPLAAVLWRVRGVLRRRPPKPQQPWAGSPLPSPPPHGAEAGSPLPSPPPHGAEAGSPLPSPPPHGLRADQRSQSRSRPPGNG